MRMRISFSLRLIFRIMLRRPIIFRQIRAKVECKKDVPVLSLQLYFELSNINLNRKCSSLRRWETTNQWWFGGVERIALIVFQGKLVESKEWFQYMRAQCCICGRPGREKAARCTEEITETLDGLNLSPVRRCDFSKKMTPQIAGDTYELSKGLVEVFSQNTLQKSCTNNPAARPCSKARPVRVFHGVWVSTTWPCSVRHGHVFALFWLIKSMAMFKSTPEPSPLHGDSSLLTLFLTTILLEDQVQAGEWDEVERYLSGFTKVEDNRYSMKIFFEIRKQKYLEALDRQDRARAVEILVKDLRVFASFNEDLFKEITQLLTLDNFRQNEQLSKYGDTKSARNIMLIELKKLIEANPLFRDKLTLPAFKASRLRTLINQSLNWQHQLCKNPRPNPDIKTLFTDHSCASSNGSRGPPPINSPLAGPIPKPGVFPPLGGHGPFQPVVSPPPSAIAGWMSSANPSIPHAAVAAAPPGLVQAPSSVGTNVGDISIWEVGSRERLALKTFKVWDLSACSMPFQIDAHIGGVNDIAFAHPNKQLCIVTCGDDKTIKIWDAVAGRRQYTFEGHEAPVYSVCPHYKENIQRSLGVVQFDTTRNRFLAAGDEFQIKFWDMDNTNMLTYTDGDGGLPLASPRLRFNKEGSLLAVTTSDNGIKVLANADGQRMLRMLEARGFDGPRGLSEAVNFKPSIAVGLGPIANVSASASPILERIDRIQQPMSLGNLANMESSRTADVKPRILDSADKMKSWKSPDIADSSQLKTLKLPDPLTASKVVRLLYTNSGLAVLALATNAVHKLWKWQRNERNPSGKSSASSVPQLWQPTNGALMSNDVNDAKPAEDSVACIALSKNDSYVMSASGGKVSLFNMMTFKVMTTFMPPPPAATYLAFHPQDNNILAIGMEDSTIQIYNVRVDELCMWNIDGWEKKKSRPIQAAPGHQSPLVGETRVQFHNNQSHLLVVHESQIAVYDAQLECLRSWYPRDSLSAPISSAIYSCDGLLIFTGFCDGAVGIFDADSLNLRCRIAPSAYISASISSNGNAFPVVIAAHPSDPNQFALGMSDGAVHVIEPSDGETKWGGSTSQENGVLPSIPSSSALNSQPSETPSR
ncbi:hypothetical protein DH2020_005813 [Rehmannia glutinosa]|uniref:CTLH domain-containing protein n=1 Tax=Rehmannia glutinosa TaxID=99300 RepID=A0ABR0XHC3_REHGL